MACTEFEVPNVLGGRKRLRHASMRGQINLLARRCFWIFMLIFFPLVIFIDILVFPFVPSFTGRLKEIWQAWKQHFI